MTAEQLLGMPRGYGQRYELIEGHMIVREPAGFYHGTVAGTIFASLKNFVTEHELGVACSAETGFQLSREPDTVRAPDAAFVSASLVAKHGMVMGYFPTAPDLAVEVNSPSDTPSKVRTKAKAWLSAGTRMVIVLDPKTRTATVYLQDNSVVELTNDDTLDGFDVVPGWSVVVSSLFE